MDARFETAINDLCGVYSRFTETVTSILLKLPVRSKDTGKYATLREFTSNLEGESATADACARDHKTFEMLCVELLAPAPGR